MDSVLSISYKYWIPAPHRTAALSLHSPPHFRLFTFRFHYAYQLFTILFNAWIFRLVIWSCTDRKGLTCSNYNELRVEAYPPYAYLQFFPESSSALCELACRRFSVIMVVILRFTGLLANTKRNINGPYVKHTFRHRPLAEGRCPRRRVPQSPWSVPFRTHLTLNPYRGWWRCCWRSGTASGGSQGTRIPISKDICFTR